MAKISQFLFGYRVITLPPESLSRFGGLLLRASVVSDVYPDGRVVIYERDLATAQRCLAGVEHEISECKGFVGFIKRIRHKPAMLLAIITSLFIALFSSDFVWDIRVEGNTTVTDTAVIEALEKCGFAVGDRWSQKDKSVIEVDLLTDLRQIAWININRRGTVAYVTVLENNGNPTDGVESLPEYANIVAAADSVIEEITVKRGIPMVKVGDAVKKGDLLIAGVLPDEAGGGLCRAEGTVIGRACSEIRVDVERSHMEKTEKSKSVAGISIKIFKFCANIFKKHRNLQDECVIIEEITMFSLFGKCMLPIELQVDYLTSEESIMLDYSDTELVSVATARLNSETATLLRECDLISIRTGGNFTDSGYTMFNKVTYSREVGETLPFTVEP